MSDAAQIFEDAIRWLRDGYDDRPFFLERDVVYAVQLRLWEQIRAHSRDWSVSNDYPMIPGPRRHLSADLAIRSDGGDVLLAAEFARSSTIRGLQAWLRGSSGFGHLWEDRAAEK